MERKKEVFSCVMVCLAAFTQGTMFLWNSFSLPSLMEEHSLESDGNISGTSGTQNFTEGNKVEGHNESLIASAHSIGAALGAILSGFVLTLGPMHVVIPLLSVFIISSWALMVHGVSMLMMIAGKILLGLSVTLQCSQVPLYIAHVAPTEHRGLLLSSISIIRNLSQIIVTAAAVLLPIDWRFITYLFGVAPVAILALGGPLLHKVGKMESKTKHNSNCITFGILNVTNFSTSLNLTNRTHPILGNCLTLVPNAVDSIGEISKLPEKKMELERNYGSAKIDTLNHKTSTILKSSIIISLFAIAYILSGMGILTNFPNKLFTPNYPYNPLVATSAALFCNLIGSIISSILTRKFGLKTILIVSSGFMALCMALLSIFYNFSMVNVHNFMFYFPLIICILFFLCLSIGVGTIFIVILGEKSPLQKRSITMLMILVTMEIFEALQNFLAPIVINYLQTSGLTLMFGLHAVINIGLGIISYIFM